jgi:hypothetical protein
MRRFVGDNDNYCCDMRGDVGISNPFFTFKKTNARQGNCYVVARRKGKNL